jgi:uncharacterized protein (DUF362 family)/Pyruvate/2-oxoacid:ferredoxin oxidoreductase delta subunit
MKKVMIHKAGYDACQEAVDRAFDLFPLDVRGKKVLVKPNALRASTPEQGVVTHPAVVKAVVERLQVMQPAEIIVGDNPGMMSYGANEQTFKESGLMEAAGGHYRNIGGDIVQVDFNREFIDKVGVSRAVMDADILISVPKFKTHGLTIITGAVKNSYGFIPGALKARLHRIAGTGLRFNQLMLDIYNLRVPDLMVVDGIVGMEGNGPASTDLREIGCILAANDGVALDAVIARMMGLEPEIVPFLDIARQQGLGDHDRAAIEIVGEMHPIPNFKVPPSVERIREMPTGGGAFFDGRIQMRPRVDAKLCTTCYTCVDQCPVSALSMVDELPVVDPELCITCFCCQEMCPEMAITLG